MSTAEITQLDRSFLETSFIPALGADLTQKERLFSIRAVVAKPEPVQRLVPVFARGETVTFRYLDNGEPRPAWFMPVLQGFANLAALTQGWDGSTAHRIDRPTINRALSAIEQILPSQAPPPSVVPIPNSGLQIEWHRNGRDLEIEFNPDGAIEFYYFDEGTQEEKGGHVGPNFINVTDFFDLIW
jgi:hypothetical protein